MQQGSLVKSSRQRGPDVWQFRWADPGPVGKRIYRRTLIGTVDQYPDADSARKSVAGLLTEINTNVLKRCALPMTVAEVCAHFIYRKLASENLWRSYSTKSAYKAYLKKWIVPYWVMCAFRKCEPWKWSHGCVGCHSRKVLARKSGIYSRLFSTTHAVTNCSTTILFAWFGKAQSDEPPLVC
jgi:hypothetical protein